MKWRSSSDAAVRYKGGSGGQGLNKNKIKCSSLITDLISNLD